MEKLYKIGTGVGVMIIKDNKILLGRRHYDSSKADSELGGEDTWTMPGGKIEYQESFEEAAIREVFEETGLVIKNPEVICINNDKNDLAHFITIGLKALDFEGQLQIKEPDEIVDWQWFDLDDLPDKLFFPSDKILKNYKANRFYLSE
jgi:8-oxo-dGTP diphosphatase